MSAAPGPCFVALWPDPAARAQLSRLVERLARSHPRARPTAPHNLHLTLAFLGPLASDRVGPLREGLAGIEAPQGAWRIDRIGHFGAARVLWAGGAPDPRLEGLVAAVRGVLDQHGQGYDRRPFVPHVTLLREARAADHDPALVSSPCIDWSLSRPCLAQSLRDRNGKPVYLPMI